MINLKWYWVQLSVKNTLAKSSDYEFLSGFCSSAIADSYRSFSKTINKRLWKLQWLPCLLIWNSSEKKNETRRIFSHFSKQKAENCEKQYMLSSHLSFAIIFLNISNNSNYQVSCKDIKVCLHYQLISSLFNITTLILTFGTVPVP